MFYSHSILAKKGALSTVWIAAHLERKLRKSHVVVTNISYSVEQIMFPAVPIALRLSGHLLLGVVRIYSRKVDYLFHDCNEVATQVRMLFKPINVNLPEDANCATFQSITLPETFELDSLDDQSNLSAGVDKHFKTLDDITLPEQIPVDGSLYISITPDEDYTGSTPQSKGQIVAVTPMEEDVLPPFPMDISEEINSGPRDGSENARERTTSIQLQGSTQLNLMDDVEVIRDPVHNPGPENLSEFWDLGADASLQQENLDEPMVRKEGLSSTKERLSVSGVEAVPHHSIPSMHAVASVEANIRISPERSTPGLVLQPSPPGNKRRSRKRGQNLLFDDDIVLNNVAMKEQIEGKYISKYKRRRKEPSKCIHDVKKLKFRGQDERLFEIPIISGMCEQLRKACDIRLDSVILEPPAGMHVGPFDAQPQPECNDQNFSGVTRSLSEQIPVEQPQSNNSSDQDLQNVLVGMNEEPPVENPQLYGGTGQDLQDKICMVGEQSPIEKARFDSGFNEDVHDVIGGMSEKSPPEQPLFGAYSLENLRSPFLLDTPIEGLEARHYDTILERAKPDASVVDDLFFLEADSQTSSSVTSRVSSMSARTKAVAQYFKGHSSETDTPLSQSGSGDLCLNNILCGRKRKQSARMFFETLVLKSYDIIDVQQKEPYGDITVSLTPTLSKMLF